MGCGMSGKAKGRIWGRKGAVGCLARGGQIIVLCFVGGRTDYPPRAKRCDQLREAGSRPGGGFPLLMRCRRILSTCLGSAMTAMTFMGL